MLGVQTGADHALQPTLLARCSCSAGLMNTVAECTKLVESAVHLKPAAPRNTASYARQHVHDLVLPEEGLANYATVGTVWKIEDTT
jgi:hypothetical protein